jgi:hypothetical protein
MPNLQHVPCCLIANPHHHLIYFHWGGKKKDNDLVTRGVSCLQDQIYESFIHDPFEWIWLWKLTNWMDDGFFHTLSP